MIEDLFFYLLIKNYSEKFTKIGFDEVEVSDILFASSLPNEEEIEKLILEEIEKIDYEVMVEQNSFNRQIIDKIFFGNKFRQSTGIGQQNKQVNLSEFIRDKPYLIFNSTYFEYEDLDLQQIVEKVVRQHDITREEWFRLYTYCEKRIDDFNDVCGI